MDRYQRLIDATEQQVDLPEKGQKAYYSGKKKRHTLKTEIRTNLKGRIVHVSKSRLGSVHDFNLFKQEPPLSPDYHGFVNSGYQGIDELHSQVEFPYEATKTKTLNKEEKAYNRALSRVRVKVDHILGQLKVFRILADRYRNRSLWTLALLRQNNFDLKKNSRRNL